MFGFDFEHGGGGGIPGSTNWDGGGGGCIDQIL
jgi:hypothetical protein